MQARILYLHTPLTSGVGSKGQNKILKVVTLQLKLIGMEHRTPCMHIFCPYITLDPWGGSNDLNIFTESSHVAYHVKGKEVYTNIEAKKL